MRQSACLVTNPIVVDSCTSLLNCTPVGRASGVIDGPNIKLVESFMFVGAGLRLLLDIRGSTGCFLLLQDSSGAVLHTLGLQVSQ